MKGREIKNDEGKRGKEGKMREKRKIRQKKG